MQINFFFLSYSISQASLFAPPAREELRGVEKFPHCPSTVGGALKPQALQYLPDTHRMSSSTGLWRMQTVMPITLDASTPSSQCSILPSFAPLGLLLFLFFVQLQRIQTECLSFVLMYTFFCSGKYVKYSSHYLKINNRVFISQLKPKAKHW